MTTSCEKNTLHALDVAAAIDEHHEELFAKGYLTQAEDQMLAEQLRMAENEFHQTRTRNFESVKAEGKNLKSMAEKLGSTASMEVGTTEMEEGNRWCIWCWACFYM
jgi:hypothetical protein